MTEANIVLTMKNNLLVFSFFLLLALWCEGSRLKEIIKVGVILDMQSSVGKIAESCIHMAISDFYAANPNYRTKIALSWRDSKADVIAALSAALDLIENEEVHAIIGPQYSSEAKLLADLGRKAQVPIVSFSATSPSIYPSGNQYLIRAAKDDSFQVKALVDIVQNYGWQDIVLIYEDTEYGNGLVPFLLDAFQKIDAPVSYRISVSYRIRIPLFSNETEISKQLEKLKTMEKYVFLVHTAASVGSKLFMAAKKMGMMTDGYAWLVTQGLSKLLDPVSAEVTEKNAMQGVLGLKPLVPETKEIADFRSRWKKNITMNKLDNQMKELSLYGLLAYDTTWAVAKAVENAGILHRHNSKRIGNGSKVDIVHLGVSEIGLRILNSIKNISFHGVSGDFRVQNGELAPSKFEVYNVVGSTERIIGFWTTDQGLSKYENCSISYQSSKNRLKKPIWPGDPADEEQPTKLRIGVPYLTGAFNKFVKVEWDSNNNTKVSGVAIDIFSNAVGLLPFPVRYEFIPYVNESRQSNGTTDEMIQQIENKNFDAVVSDTTIVDYRTSYVDFTLPYSESGVRMLVRTKDDERENMWIFLKPLRWDLWLFAGLGFIFTGFVVWVLEHRINAEFRGSPRQQIGTIFWFSFSTLFFAHRERVMSNWTRFIVIIWFFVVLILSQSYTASLASMLTVRRMQPTVIDVEEILRNDLSVGYQDISFVKDFLIKNLNFKEDMLKGYKTPEEYREALLKGTRNGGVDAVIDELPYLKIFLAKYCSNFQIVGPTYQTAGFGFAFPIGSPLVSHMSKATLYVTQNKTLMDRIEKGNGDETICEEELSTSSSDSLNLSSFGGLFIITGVATISAFLIYVFRFLRSHWPKEGPFKMRLVELAQQFDHKTDSSTRDHNIWRSDSRVHPETSLHSTDNINVVVDDNLASENNNNAN